MRIDTPEMTALAIALTAPFEPAEVKWKPQAVSGNRALAIAFVDARVIMDRLDDAAGVFGWQDRYEILPDGNVVCTLSLRMAGEWITKQDVGGESEQPDEGDRRKAAFSDALKRTAVKFGIGRYLYRLPHQWVEYDPQKRKFVKPPQLPAWALPRSTPASQAQPVPPTLTPQQVLTLARSAELLKQYQTELAKCPDMKTLEAIGGRIAKLELIDKHKEELRAEYGHARERIADEMAERAAIQSPATPAKK